MAHSPRSWPTPWWNSAAAVPTTNSAIERTPTQTESYRGRVERAQVLPDNFEVEYTQQNLTSDEARARLNAANPKGYYGDADTTSVVLWGDETKIGGGATVTNGQVLTVTSRGNVLTTVTKDRAVSIDSKGRARIIRLERA